MSVFKRNGIWRYRRWVKLPDGTRTRIFGTALVNTRAAADRAERDHIERLLNPPPPAPKLVPTVAEYAEQWLAKRTNRNAESDRTRLEKHALPVLGKMRMDEVKPRHLRDLVLAMRSSGALAARTIRQVTGLLHTMFKSAAIEEVIAANPVIFERGTLPKKADKDPSWRHQAIYTRDEIEQLISDERILADRRMLYALKSLAALRHTEAAKLTWAQYDADAKPLGAINLGQTKTGVPRAVPVHPTLAKMLAEWKLSGWVALYGRRPNADDYVVPTRNMNADNPRGTAREAAEAQKQLIADLNMLGLRTEAGTRMKRRGHDMRRTMITLARTDGAIDGLLRWVTHGPTSDMMDVYSSPPWSALCAEVAKLKLSVREGAVLAPPTAEASRRWLRREGETQSVRALGGHQPRRGRAKRAQVAALAAGMLVTPKGLETRYRLAA